MVLPCGYRLTARLPRFGGTSLRLTVAGTDGELMAISSGGARTLNILPHHARKRQLRERPLLVTQ